MSMSGQDRLVTAVILAAIAGIFIGTLVVSFAFDLPGSCATPEVARDYIVKAYCSK